MKVVPLFNALLLILISLVPGCVEHLPPYADPRHILSATTSGEYVLSSTENSVNFFVKIRNDYDESLQAVAVISGKLDVTLQRDSSVRKTMVLTNGNLVRGNNYVPSTGQIILDPGDTVTLLSKWDWIDDTGRDLRLQVFRYHEDLECDCDTYNRALAEEEVFVLQGEVKIFDKIESSKFGPSFFNVRFASRYVIPRYCPPIVPWRVPAYGPKPCIPRTFAPFLSMSEPVTKFLR